MVRNLIVGSEGRGYWIENRMVRTVPLECRRRGIVPYGGFYDKIIIIEDSFIMGEI